MANNALHLSEDKLNDLKEDTDYWTNKASDLCLDLETLKGEIELDADNISDDHDRICKELATVEASLKRLQSQNHSLKQSISEKSKDVDTQQVKIMSQQSDIDKIGNQLDDLIQDNKRREEAPELTVQEYIMQLADRGEVAKLGQLHQTTYTKISMLVQQQQIMQLQQMQKSMGENGATENGQMPFQQQMMQMNGQVTPGAPGQPFMGNPMFNMAPFGAVMQGAEMSLQQQQQMPGQAFNQQAAFMNGTPGMQQQAQPKANGNTSKGSSQQQNGQQKGGNKQQTNQTAGAPNSRKQKQGGGARNKQQQ